MIFDVSHSHRGFSPVVRRWVLDMKNRFNGNYIVDSLRWYVFFKALKARDVKAWANGPGLSAYVMRSAESAAYACSRLQTLRAFSAQLFLLCPPGPLGRAITSGAFGAACN